MKIEQFYKNLLRQIQSLPRNTANEAIYMMIGSITLEGHLHLRIMSLFGAITRLDPHNPLHQLANRQLSLSIKNSWFTYVRDIADIYDIDVYDAMNFPPSKEDWKNYCRVSIVNRQWSNLLSASKEKSTLVNLTTGLNRSSHHIWQVTRGKPDLMESAIIKAKFLTGKPGLNGDNWRIKSGENTSCPLCEFPVEDGIHCLLKCKKLENVRFKIINFLNLWKEDNVLCPKQDAEIFQALINGNSFKSHDDGTRIYLVDNAEHAQRLSMRICSMIMKERDIMINNKLMGDEI